MEYLNDCGEKHRENGPAVIYYHINENMDLNNINKTRITRVEYWLNGNPIDGKKAAIIKFNSGRVSEKIYFNHCINNIKYDNKRNFIIKTITYNDNTSIEEVTNRKNVLLQITYKKNNVLHRENAPATIIYNNTGLDPNYGLHLYYYKNGELHRENGPAKVIYDNNYNISQKEYFMNGNHISDPLKILIMEALEKGGINYEIQRRND